ncbi:hypothetical protein H0264_20270 [Nocardia huaxiensis]|uniref:Small secreted domain DUF320 n=1 Tax=Nocardia huaxiensis TaxID=2755382 RepID=A0A7D6VED4_9NOCA|nr:hypothetical protein [Nocardia huaxiensis]QLY27790.1 hypothetical protein H0264_20270 [Nocardia huaxiensis]
MKSLVLKACAAAVITVGLGAAPALAVPLELQPGADPVAGLVPETGSSGALNGIVCTLQTISASAPCRNT